MIPWPETTIETKIGPINICGRSTNRIMAYHEEYFYGRVEITIQKDSKQPFILDFKESWINTKIAAAVTHYLTNNKDFYAQLPVVAREWQKATLKDELFDVDDELAYLNEQRCEIESELRNLS